MVILDITFKDGTQKRVEYNSGWDWYLFRKEYPNMSEYTKWDGSYFNHHCKIHSPNLNEIWWTCKKTDTSQFYYKGKPINKTELDLIMKKEHFDKDFNEILS